MMVRSASIIALALVMPLMAVGYAVTRPDKADADTVAVDSRTIGYCPTMERYANDLAASNFGMEPIRFESAGAVLSALKANEIDFALVGRKATVPEISAGIDELRLSEGGVTLIAPRKRIISEHELGDVEIRTCLPAEDVIEYSNLKLVVVDSCDWRNGEVWLISWDHYADDMNLLIPVDRFGNKIDLFRSPFLYGKDLTAFTPLSQSL
jgi:hypothetical protein